MGSWEFWAGYGGLVLLAFGVFGLLFVWSVALISPPASNRAFIVRHYTLGFWIATAIGFGICSLHLREPGPMIVWGMIGCLLFSLQMLIAVCERDEWGTRVPLRIPRNFFLRALAFLFYSGAAGGIAFGVIGAVLTVIGVAMWYTIVPYTSTYRPDNEPLLVIALLAAYAYCYSLSAAVVRRLFAS